MKRFPVLSILYYGFTIIFGIILAFYWFALGAQIKASETLTKRAKAGDTQGVVSLLSGYYNENKVDSFEIENVGSLDIYEVVTTYTSTKEVDGTTKSYTLLEKGYMGIIYNVSDSWDREDKSDSDGKTYNRFGVRFNGVDSEGNTQSYFYRIGYDSTVAESESSEIQNRAASYSACSFYYFLIGDRAYQSFTQFDSMDFITSDDKVVASQTFSQSYQLTSDFFTVTGKLVTDYNALALNDNATSDNVNAILEVFNNSYKEYENFKTSDYQDVIKNVNLYSSLKLLAYIVIVLIIGDFLVGKHRIIHAFKKLFGKEKSKFEEVETTYYNEHELNVTVEAKVPEGYDKTITVKYVSESQKEIVYNLNKDNEYKLTQLITSGVYNHPVIIADGLKCVDVPSELKINGLKYSVKLEFIYEEK